MEDLFNFGNTDNILLGTPKNVATKQAGFSATSIVNDDSKTDKKDAKKEKNIKIVIVGDPQVGKTAFLTKHLNGSFDSKYRATMGASTFNLEFNTNLDSHKYEVLDVAGQNLFAGKRDQHYKDIKGAIIMYDVMNWASYDNVTDVWLRELKEKAPSGTPICIVGNKMENRDTRKVSVEVVAEAISNTFEPKGIHYCEISVKTNQNLAEPFLFLTKKILNIHDNKALYFVSKISELNLIESMLQHKKSKDDKEKESQDNNNKSSPKSQNLDNLFLNDSTKTNNNNGNKAKGGDYLDDIIFKIGDNNNNNNQSAKSKASQSKSPTDDNFLADMMGNAPMTKSKSHEPKVIPPPKTSTITTRSPKMGKSQSISPKNQTSSIQSTSLSRSQSESRNRASSASVKVTTAVPTINSNNKNRKSSNQQSRSKPKQQRVVVNNDQSVMIDILLGLQETLNNLQSDVRRLQSDVSYLKQEFQKGKSQRR
mmetsp:Transcript_36827/g.32534  ORF Transcript_36827/g.32534 Transcript_36827/m.32534 type:complete len:480 (+) Transcript_36827:22-1461(+)